MHNEWYLGQAVCRDVMFQKDINSLSNENITTKFIFMHWTNIAWALDLDGLSKNLMVASLEGDEKDTYLTTLQTMSSFNRTNGKTKDFLFASTRDMILAPSKETEEENKVEELKRFRD